MRKVAFFLFSFFCAGELYSQNLEAYLTLDTRTGYSTNTFLHPSISEWDESDSGAYSRVSPTAEIFWYGGRFTADVSGGYLFESTFDDRKNWTGVYGASRLNYQLSNQLSLEVQTSGSRLSSIYDRTSVSILPALSWSPSLFTRVHARAGTSSRKYHGLTVEEDNSLEQTADWFNVYGLEVERWASLKWQIRGSVYGLMDQNLFENHSLSFALSRIFRQSSGVTLNFSLNKYQNRLAFDADGGRIPTGNPASEDEIQYEEESDMLLKSGVSFSFPLVRGLSGNGSVSHLLFMPSVADSRSDAELSIGIRYRFSASTIFQQNQDKLSPDWDNREDDDVVIVKIRYRGDGDLYLVGEFNDWDRPGIPLSRQNENSGRYAVQIELEPGIYEYKVLMLNNGEEKWVELSDDTMTVSDGFGGTNGLIFID